MPVTRVLIVDDHNLVREGISSLLKQVHGIEVVGEANSGPSALAIAKETEPEIVLMDVNMPGMNGIEATRQIHQALPTARFIALTVSDDVPLLEAMLRAGASGFVVKSRSAEVLIQAIRDVAAGNVFICPELAKRALKSFVKLVRQLNPAESAGLTSSECAVLTLVASGKSNKQIAAELNISPRTVQVHRTHINQKLNISSDAEMTKCAIRFGLTPLDLTDGDYRI
ncbi:MAG TPA: response regulator transcription factor [Planctomycetota bacterium]|jgi:DNA-binding NarL/FixJ family response regulator